jgi:hypothetical protein
MRSRAARACQALLETPDKRPDQACDNNRRDDDYASIQTQVIGLSLDSDTLLCNRILLKLKCLLLYR